jgi:hypothetical protein
MTIRDRIKELRRVPAAELLPNPRNWRTHPERQRDALKGVLAEIGYASSLLARETGEGGLMLIDGHLRAETTPNTTVPVLILDLNDEEADKLLATLDPLASLAGTNAESLTQLLGDVRTDNAALHELLADLARQASPNVPAASEAGASDMPSSHTVLHPQFHIVIACDDEQQQTELLERFSEEGLSCRALVV